MVDTNPAPGVSEAFVSGIASFGDMAPGVAASIVTRNPLPMMAYLGAYSRGSTYADKRGEGVLPQPAVTAANLYALSEATPEALPLAVILQRGGSAAWKIGGGAATEAVSEAMTSGLQALVDQGVLDETMTWAQAKEEMAKAAAAGGVMGMLMGGGAVTYDKVAETLASRRAKRNTPADPNAPQLTAAPTGGKPAPKAEAPAPAPSPDATILDAMGGTPPAAAPQGQTMTQGQVDAQPDRFEVMPELEGQDLQAQPTGRMIARDRQDGKGGITFYVITPDDAIPAQAGDAPGQGGAGVQPQASAPDQGPATPPAADSAPDQVQTDLLAAMGAPAPQPTKPAPAGQIGKNIEMLDEAQIANIQTDAKAFQYKDGGDESGVTDRLRGVTKWDTDRAGIVWLFERKDGTRVVADGHQRLGLAKRLSGQGQDVQVLARVYREADGYTPEQVRTIAALRNIGEGTGTATDAAKVLRDTGKGPQQLGLPPNSALVRDAQGLSTLSGDAFGMVINGVATEQHGAIVGRVVQDQAAQSNILGLLTRLKPANAFQAESIARQAADATTTETQGSLFGDEDVAANLYLERAKILDAALKLARDESRTFKTLIDEAVRVEGAGNVLATDENQKRVETATMLRDYLSKQANTKGPISDALTNAARALKSGAKPGAVTRDFIDTVTAELRGAGAGNAAGDGGRPAGSGADQGQQAPAVTPPPEAAPDAEPARRPPTADDFPDLNYVATGGQFGRKRTYPGFVVSRNEGGGFSVTREGETTPVAGGPTLEAIQRSMAMFRNPFTGEPFVAPTPAPDPVTQALTPATDVDGDLFAAMGGKPAQPAKTPAQVRAEAEAKVRADQSKIRKTGGNSGDSGPLFNGQGDMLDAPKRMSGADLWAKGQAALADLIKSTDAIYDAQIDSKDVSDSTAGRDLLNRLAAVDGLEARKAVADAWVGESGRKANVEFLVVLDKAGLPLAVMKGKKAGVSVNAAVFRAAEAGRIGYATHNHPQSSGHSGPDVSMALFGFAPMTVVPHVGPVMTISVPESSTVTATMRHKDGTLKQSVVIEVLGSMKSQVFGALRAQFSARGLNGKEADDLWFEARRDIYQAVLDRMGLITYDKPGAVASFEALGLNFEDIYGQISGNGADRLRRAGVRFTEGGSDGGNRPSGSDADTAPPGTDGADQGAQGNGSAGDGDGAAPQGVTPQPDEVDRFNAAKRLGANTQWWAKASRENDGQEARDVLEKAGVGFDRIGRPWGDIRADDQVKIETARDDLYAAPKTPAPQTVADIGDVREAFRLIKITIRVSKDGVITAPDPHALGGGSMRLGYDTEYRINPDGTMRVVNKNPVAERAVKAWNDRKATPSTPPAKPAKPSTGDADIDGALDDLFGDQGDVSGTGGDLERDSGDGTAADGMGGSDVPPAAGRPDRGTGGRGNKAGSGNRKPRGGGGVSGDDAASVGDSGNKPVLGPRGASGKPADGGDGGSSAGNRTGGLSPDAAGNGNPAGNAASGTGGKLTAAQRLAAIRNALKEDTVEFVTRRGRQTFKPIDALPRETIQDIVAVIAERVPAAREFTLGAGRPEYLIAEMTDLIDPLVVRLRDMPLDRIKGYNRQNSELAVRKYVAMLAAGSKAPPILLDGSKFIDGGHRFAAYRAAGKRTIPAVDIGPLLRMDWQGWLDGLPVENAPVASAMNRPKDAQGFSEDTPAFRAWFGDSKVVDADGKPLVVYHGTSADFEAFQISGRTGAIWATQDPTTADRFASGDLKRPGDVPNVMPLYLSLQRPFDTANPPTELFGELKTLLTPEWAGKRQAKTIQQSFDADWANGDFSSILGINNGFITDRVREFLLSRGIDGVIARNFDGSVRAYAAFSPNQIKSIFNRGTFDPTNPNMLAEDVASIDMPRYEALAEIFDEATDGMDLAALSRRDAMRQIISPLAAEGMTREEVAAITPYFQRYYEEAIAGRRVKPEPAPKPIEAEDRAAQQARADRTKPVAADLDNIRATLPLLMPEQQDDILKIETRFAKPDGHGMLITNGTGTGKTYTGAGTVKRFVQSGRGNVLIVGPNAGVLRSWKNTLADLGVEANVLDDTKSAGQGVVLTTYANLEQNDALASREWDLVVPDESHNLMSNAAGDATGALRNLRAITHRSDSDLRAKSHMLHAADWAAHKKMRDGEAKSANWRRLKAREDADVERFKARPRSKVLFLSASPFAYSKTVDYAEGYLFSYPPDGHVGHSRQSGRSIFMVQNLGYRIRYHKLTEPDAAVDQGVFQREFHEKLKRDGVLSGRSLQVDVDYDRRFVATTDAEGSRIDDAVQIILDAERQARESGDKDAAKSYEALYDHHRKVFDYLHRAQLLEAIKAKAAIRDAEKHLALGRKVVVFHDFNVGGGFHPFKDQSKVPMSPEALAAWDTLSARHKWMDTLNFEGYLPPVDAFLGHFGDRAKAYNGRVSKKRREANLDAFNRDGSGTDILVVQADAGGAGISMHDTTGNHQRVILNLGLPAKPVTVLQEEGRILRVGSRTDAAFRYYTIGTDWERHAFAQRVATRTSAVENLALGNEARDLRNAFIDAYLEAEAFDPSPADGKGGKAKHAAQARITPYEQAKTHYFARAKLSGRRDQRDGIDFYPTPEPLAFKMVEWAGLRPNERVLEPSAGDGAIARYFGDSVDATIIEPSRDLAATALLRTPGARLVQGDFEDYHIVNKHHVIVMNPPFRAGGKTAIDHMKKALTHLRPGGRLVALIPTGPAADKRFEAEKWPGIMSTVLLPSVAFEKAGTGVRTRVVILDTLPAGLTDAERDAAQADAWSRAAYIDLSSAATIKEFFDRLENVDVARRPQPVTDAVEELEAEAEAAQQGDPVRPPRLSAPLAASVGAFEKTEVTSKAGKKLPGASHAAKVEREIYKMMEAAAKDQGGWYHSAAVVRGKGPVFGFRTVAQRDAFLDAMQKPTLMEDAEFAGFNEDAVGLVDPNDEGAEFAAQFMSEIAQVDDLFRYQASEATTLRGVFADVDPTIQLVGELAEDDPRVVARDVETATMFVTETDKPFYIYETADSVWIDVSDLGKGEGGSAIYAAIADYALNTGKTFIGDPEGLSAAALRRRTDNMLSSALKHGTTRHLEPHEYQLDGDERLGVPPLRWTEGDEVGNLRSLIEVSVANLISHEPEVADARYDFQAGTFRTGEGQPLTDESLDKWASSAAGNRKARVGRATLKRGILLNSLLRAGSAERPGLLERVLRQPRELVTRGGLRRTFYQAKAAHMLAEARASTQAIAGIMPRLRAELDRLDLKRVRLVQREPGKGEDWQGYFHVTGDGTLEIVIGASMDPMKTLHHEVIHALRAMDLFTPEEWRALGLAAEKTWLKKHDIEGRYPDLTREEQIEEAIAEEFSEALEAKRSPNGSLLVNAFNKIARLFKAFRTVLTGQGYKTVDQIFGAVLGGEISARNAFNTGVAARMGLTMQGRRQAAKFQRAARAVRPLTAQGRAHRNTGMHGALFIPDRRVWEELTRANAPIWQRLRGARGAASDAVDRARFVIQDRFLPVLRAQEALKRLGVQIPPEQNAYVLEELFSGKVGKHLSYIDEQFTKPIVQAIANTKGGLSVESVGEWLYARHAIERNARIAQINPNMPDGGSGMMTADAQQILSDAAAGPHAAVLNRIGALIDALRAKTIDLREDAGLMSNEEADMWRTMYAHYVPLKGFADTDQAEAILDLRGGLGSKRLNTRGAESQRALGRGTEAFNPLVAALTQAQEVAIRAEKNRVGQSLYELARDYPSKALWEVKKPKQKRYYNRTTGLVETRVEDPVTMILEPNEMAVKIGGEEHRILFHDERLADAALNLGADQLDIVVKTIGPFSRYFSMINTMLNPVFVLTNAIRDFTAAQIMTIGLDKSDAADFTLSPGQRAKIMWAMTRNWKKAFVGALRGQGGAKDTEWTRHFYRFQRSGGQISFWMVETPEAQKLDLEKRIHLARGNMAARGTKVLLSPSSWLSERDNAALFTIQRVNLAVDNAIRLAAFVEAQKIGLTEQQAASLAKNLTVNFNRRGKFGAVMNALFPFSNSGVQGTTRLLQAVANPRLLIGLTVGGIGLGLLMDLVNAALSDEDDDGMLVYDKIPDYKNRRFIQLMTGDNAYSVPLPYGIGIFPYAGQQLGKVMRGVKSGDDAMADLFSAFAMNFLPMDDGIPTVMQPFIEVKENKNFFGSAIYPEDFYGDNRYLPDAAKFFPSASEASKFTAMQLNKATGGDELTSGSVDVSPEVLDHFSAFFTGGAGRFVGQSVDLLAKVMSGKTADIETKDIPFVGTFKTTVSPWYDKGRFKTFAATIRDAKHYVEHLSALSSPPSAEHLAKMQKIADLYDTLLRAENEMDGKKQFNPNSNFYERPARDEAKVIADFNKKASQVIGMMAE